MKVKRLSYEKKYFFTSLTYIIYLSYAYKGKWANDGRDNSLSRLY